MPVTILLVFVGGGLGAMLRALSGLIFPPLGRGEFALDILAANLTACLLLGVVDALWVRERVAPGTHLFLTTGVAGGLSTFSTFIHTPMVAVAKGGSVGISALYLFGSMIAGLLAILLGQALGARMAGRV